MARINFMENGFELDMEGIEKFLAIKGKLFVPYEHVTAIDDNAEGVKAYLRVGGTALGHRHYDYGRFLTNQGPAFYVIKNKENAFAIHLRDEKYNLIVLELDDNASAINELRKKLNSSKLKTR